jgi:copper chaperone CopZ
MKKIILEIRGMHCAGCSRRLGRILEGQPGVGAANVDFLKGVAAIDANDAIDLTAIGTAIDAAGFIYLGARDA